MKPVCIKYYALFQDQFNAFLLKNNYKVPQAAFHEKEQNARSAFPIFPVEIKGSGWSEWEEIYSIGKTISAYEVKSYHFD